MVHKFRFERVLSLREQKKKSAEERYRESVKSFEEIAQKLYELLKQKERMLENQDAQMGSGMPIQTLRHGQQFLGNIEKSIAYQQKLVMEARAAMQWHEANLLEQSIEVKKFEKMKTKDATSYLTLVRENETRQLDEMSLIRFSNREIR